MYKTIKECRIGGGSNLIKVLSLGEQYLTGVFPKDVKQEITKGPIDMVWCPESGLLQLSQTYDLAEMYGENYGYRSGLNKSMVKHLANKVQKIESLINIDKSDIVIDIGSNDATTLKSYKSPCRKVGIDPTALKFKEYYTQDITIIPDFFTFETFNKAFENGKAKVITSIAMFYDLEAPLKFVADIKKSLAEDGVWHFEQSYMPSMLKTNSYDTLCHEHLEFYSLAVVKNILETNDLRIMEVDMNEINGGSFAVTACHMDAKYKSNSEVIDKLLVEENEMGLNTERPYKEFADRTFAHRNELVSLLNKLRSEGKSVLGYGASTKGNVLLQFCGLTTEHISAIAEVNPDKFGAYTPGTNIPIISEEEAKQMNPDYFIVLPWHFKASILEREKKFLASGGKFIFPLPMIEIIGA